MACSARAADPVDDTRQAALRGLRGCLVVAMSMNDRITSAQVRSAAQDRLRAAKIRVVEKVADVRELPGKPTLTVIVSDYVSLRLVQDVALKRDPSIALAAETWSSTCILGKGRTLVDVLNDCIDQFVQDYRSANPRRTRRRR